MPQPIHYQTNHKWTSHRMKKTLKNTYWDWLITIYLTMNALCDSWLQVWWEWMSTIVVKEMAMEMAVATVCGWWRTGLGSCVRHLVLSLLTSRWDPFNGRCWIGRPTSESMPYELLRPYGTPSFVLFLRRCILMIRSSSILLPFHFHTWFLPCLAHFLWKHIKERICGFLCIH